MDLTARKLLSSRCWRCWRFRRRGPVDRRHSQRRRTSRPPKHSTRASIATRSAAPPRNAARHPHTAGQLDRLDLLPRHAGRGAVPQGRNADALAEFDQACQLFLAYPNWLLQVQFQQPPRPDPNRGRRVPPWGRSERTFVIGQFSDTETGARRRAGCGRRLQEGGVVRRPMYWRVNVVEVMRMTALAIRRRNELLGPLARAGPDLQRAVGRARPRQSCAGQSLVGRMDRRAPRPGAGGDGQAR